MPALLPPGYRFTTTLKQNVKLRNHVQKKEE